MLIPKYTITNPVLKNISATEAAKEMILSSSLIPAWENKLKRQAMEKFIYFGVRMEGNKIMEEEVGEIIDGREVEAQKMDILEVENNQKLYRYIGSLASNPNFRTENLDLETIDTIHQIACAGLIPAEKLGKERGSQVVIRNMNSGEISYSPPPAAEIEYLLEDLFNFLSTDGLEVHPIIKAAIIHLEIYRIHPFLEGNVSVARALSLLVLKKEGYSINGFLSFEEYFDSTLTEYYSLLQGTSGQKAIDSFERDLTLWIEYFTLGIAMEVSKLKEFVRKISQDSRAQDELGESFTLNERQMIIMEYLERHKSMMNKDFRKIFPDHSDDTVLRELKFLKQKGLVKKIGGTKKATYTIASG